MNIKVNYNWLCINLGLLILCIYILPFVILGEDAFIRIYDFLDGKVAHYHTIASLKLIGNLDGYMPVMDGTIPLLAYSPIVPVSVSQWLHYLVPTYWAIILTSFFVKAVAFIGMYILCTNYLIKDSKLLSFLVSIAFSLIPFYSDYSLSSAGIPLLIYAIVNLEFHRKIGVSLLLIAFFTANSSLALIGFFVCIIWAGWIIYRLLFYKQFPIYHALGILIMGLIYIYTNMYILFNFLFPSNIISNRVEFNYHISFEDALNTLRIVINSHEHAGNFTAISILFICFLFIFRYWNSNISIRKYVYALVICLTCIVIGHYAKNIPLAFFKAFDLQRFFFFPTLVFILLAKTFSLIKTHNQSNHEIIIVVCAITCCCLFTFTVKLVISFVFLSFLIAQTLYFFDIHKVKIFLCIYISVIALYSTISHDPEISNNTSLLLNKKISAPSFKQYYDEDLFYTIKSDLDIPNDYSCKVVTMGMHPSIAEYNRFYTLDSFVYSYSLNYKHTFRKIIAKELEKNEVIKERFDGWGCRCYLFSSELYPKQGSIDWAKVYGKNDNTKIHHFEINTDELKRLGCQYIFSAVEICNYKDLNLAYVNSYTMPQSFFNIRVYKL